MIHSENNERKIGFDKIKQLVAGFCLSDLGRDLAMNSKFSDDYQFVLKQLNSTEELHTILISDEPFPRDDYFNLKPELKRLKTPGTFFEIEKLIEFKLSYVQIQNIIDYLRLRGEKYPYLLKLSADIIVFREVIQKNEKILDEKGQIRDDASEELKKIRSNIASLGHQIERRTRQILLSLKKENIIPSEAEITMRNGRCVIPIGAANKRKIKGYVHDESATGQTVFIEPAEIFEMNNTLREYLSDEKKEIIKILLAFTDFIRPLLSGLTDAYEFLGTIDFIRAKALLAIETKAVKPALLKKPFINWQAAINPLLYLHFRDKNKKVVPYNINLDSDQRILVISGPNAGGKSVCLKTIGLLQYMLQSGFLIPVNDGSEAGVFSEIFIEIGDEQSIENDLSTYSSHLMSLKYFIENARPDTLFLIDEFGSGTDPLLGGAIAEAALDELNKKKSFGAVTTHYANLKEFAARTDGILNGSMLFDTVNLKPLFKLIIGNPGSSYALEIAENIGLQKNVIDQVIKIVGQEKITFEKQILNFEIEKEELENEKAKVKMADEFFSEMIDKYQNLLTELEENRKTIIQEAKIQATALIQNTNSIIENTIRQIKETGADREKTKQIRNEIEEYKEKIISKTEPKELKIKSRKKVTMPKTIVKAEKISTPVTNGSYVKMPGQTAIGEVVELKNGQALVLYNNMKIHIPVSQLEVVKKTEYIENLKRTAKTNLYGVSKRLDDKIAGFKTTLDVRGKRADEISEIIEKYIDDALLLKNYNLRIIHGKGSGVLRTIIHEILSKHKNVVSYASEQVEHGGDGITLLELK